MKFEYQKDAVRMLCQHVFVISKWLKNTGNYFLT